MLPLLQAGRVVVVLGRVLASEDRGLFLMLYYFHDRELAAGWNEKRKCPGVIPLFWLLITFSYWVAKVDLINVYLCRKSREELVKIPRSGRD